jgi:endonuclease YncB( thermonuclease family)
MKHRNIGQAASALLALALLLVTGLPRVRDARRDVGRRTTAETRFLVQGCVIAIADGDSLEVRTDDQPRVGVRLFGIDAPEGRQASGRQARDALKREIQGRRVEIRVVETDQYGRLVGDLYRDGTWINEAQVARGWAWHYTRYSDHPALARAEREARAARRGLWRDPHPTPPWIWRQRHPREATREVQDARYRVRGTDARYRCEVQDARYRCEVQDVARYRIDIYAQQR